MTSLASELTELGSDTPAWVARTLRYLVVFVAISAAAAFPLHFVLNPLASVLGYPHAIGGYWESMLVVLGAVSVPWLVATSISPIVDLIRGVERKDDGVEMSVLQNFTSMMVAVGIAAWVVTWIITGNAT